MIRTNCLRSVLISQYVYIYVYCLTYRVLQGVGGGGGVGGWGGEESEGFRHPAVPSRVTQRTTIDCERWGVERKILVEGLDIFSKYIEWQNENNMLTKVISRDTPVEFTKKNLICNKMDKYGKIVKAEREMVQVDGKHTQWTNGTWHLFMTNLYDAIPGK